MYCQKCDKVMYRTIDLDATEEEVTQKKKCRKCGGELEPYNEADMISAEVEMRPTEDLHEAEDEYLEASEQEEFDRDALQRAKKKRY